MGSIHFSSAHTRATMNCLAPSRTYVFTPFKKYENPIYSYGSWDDWMKNEKLVDTIVLPTNEWRASNTLYVYQCLPTSCSIVLFVMIGFNQKRVTTITQWAVNTFFSIIRIVRCVAWTKQCVVCARVSAVCNKWFVYFYFYFKFYLLHLVSRFVVIVAMHNIVWQSKTNKLTSLVPQRVCVCVPICFDASQECHGQTQKAKIMNCLWNMTCEVPRILSIHCEWKENWFLLSEASTFRSVLENIPLVVIQLHNFISGQSVSWQLTQTKSEKKKRIFFS